MSDCIREEVNKQGRRQVWLADKIGISPVRLSLLLSGKVRWKVEEAIKAADALGVPVRDLFLTDDERETSHCGK
jgi:DNA-binding XRE family transcriptional regulator